MLIVTTLGLFCLPMLPAIIELRNKSDVQPLEIERAHMGDIRHFADRFRSVLAEITAKGNQEWRVHHISIPTPDSEFLNMFRNSDAPRILVTEGNCTLPDHISIQSDIHARQSLVTGLDSRIRAALVEDLLTFSADSVMLRWAHARQIIVGENCKIMGRLSADEEIALAPGSVFQRLNAPAIYFGAPAKFFDAFWSATSATAGKARQLHNGDLELASGVIHNTHLIVRGNLRIGRDAKIFGSVKSHGDTTLEPGVTIAGALVCGGSLESGPDCRILGPVVAETAITISTNTLIGSVAQPTTVTAPVIRIATGAIVCGTVWARTRGTVV